MAKKSLIQNTMKKQRLVEKFSSKRMSLKAQACKKDLSVAERFQAQSKLAALPRNSSKTRVRQRCLLTGRARGVYRKFRLSRIMLREMASFGLIPGMIKASW